MEYDANNNLTRTVVSGNDGKNAVITENQYDEADRLISRKRDKENAKSWIYNAANKVIKTVGKSGIEISYLHDSLGRLNGKLCKAGSGTGNEQLIIRSQQYNDNFQLTSYRNANEKEITYQYDDSGRVVSTTNENGDVYQYNYDERSNLNLVTTPGDNKVAHSYDAIGRIEKRKFAGNSKKEESFRYDSTSRLVAAASDKAKMTWEYDSLSRMIKQTQNKKTVGFTHDNAGNLTSISYPGGNVLQYNYDEAGRVTAITDNQQRTIATYQYNPLGQFDSIIYYNGSRADFKYDGQQRLESIKFTDTANKKLLDGTRYGYDAAGRVIFEVHLYQGKDKGDRYFYDNANRLIKAQYGVDNVSDVNSSFENETLFTYTPEGLWSDRTTLDSIGNVLKKETGVSNKLNNYASLGSIAYAYNKEGNCLMEARFKDGTILANHIEWDAKTILNTPDLQLYWTFEYDEHMRISKAVQHDRDGNILFTIEYFYDTSGHLIERIETDASGVITDYTFVYAGDMLIQEWMDGVLVKQHTYGPTLGIPVKTDFLDNGKWQESLNFFDCMLNITSMIDGLKKDARQRFGFDAIGSGHIFEINGVSIPKNDAHSDISKSISSLLRGVRNGLSGKFGDAMSMFTDVKNGRDIFNGKAHNTQNGHTANPTTFNGGNRGRNWGLISQTQVVAAGAAEAGGFWSKLGKASDLFGVFGGVKSIYDSIFGSDKSGKEDNKSSTLDIDSKTAGFKINIGNVFSFQMGPTENTVHYTSNTKPENDTEKKPDAGTKNAGSKTGSKGGSTKDGGVKDGGTDGGVKDGGVKNGGTDAGSNGNTKNTGCTCDPATECKSDAGSYTNPDYDSGGAIRDPKIIEAKLFGNVTPMNPALSGFVVTPEYFETTAKQNDMIALYGGGDVDNANNDIRTDFNESKYDPKRNTNTGNRLREGPDFTNFPRPGGLKSMR